MHTLEHYEHVCTHIHCDTPSHSVVLELATRFMSYLNCLFPMIDIQFATLCCPYDHALSHPRYQRQQIEYSEFVDLGTGVWFLHGKGSRGFFCLLSFSFQPSSFISPACYGHWSSPASTVHHPSADEPPWDASRLSVFAHRFPWLLWR